MSLLDKGIDLLKSTIGLGDDKEKTGSAPGKSEEKSGNFIVDIIKEQLGFKEKVEDIKENSEKERASLFGEAMGSGFRRMFPTLSKWLDVGKIGGSALGVVDRGAEGHALQHEIESLTPFTLFIPDFMLKHATDLFFESETFQKVVEIWPMMPDELRQAMKDPNYDPDDLISIIRIMNQDLATGKVTYETLSEEGLKGLLPDALKDVIPENDNNDLPAASAA